MAAADHLQPRIPDLKVNRKSNEINDLPTPPPRQCWVCEPPVIALKTRGPQLVATFAGQGLDLQWSTPEAFRQLISPEARQWRSNVESMKLTID
ncbi:MAG: hypothetical protein PSV40_09010 [Polaromonas sp.]|uniref:hypothetical protein n=1 Tax=Polaromonas sp. TaxID=1869339 RepID=UPI00248A8A26|nr:hypothetical protein [Polaromonas sp.]MDI1269227.1 hypothetical protein [Polaromonas sp.]